MKNIIIHKEIDLVQACINRMAHNSFIVKGWTITLVVIVLTLAEKTSNPIIINIILIIPIIGFWYLDAFFLQTEKKYIKLYEWNLKNRKDNNMDLLYDLNPHRFDKNVENIFKTMQYHTISIFYGLILLLNICSLIFKLVYKDIYNIYFCLNY